jgi:hypothetical protein
MAGLSAGTGKKRKTHLSTMTGSAEYPTVALLVELAVMLAMVPFRVLFTVPDIDGGRRSRSPH